MRGEEEGGEGPRGSALCDHHLRRRAQPHQPMYALPRLRSSPPRTLGLSATGEGDGGGADDLQFMGGAACSVVGVVLSGRHVAQNCTSSSFDHRIKSCRRRLVVMQCLLIGKGYILRIYLDEYWQRSRSFAQSMAATYERNCYARPNWTSPSASMILRCILTNLIVMNMNR